MKRHTNTKNGIFGLIAFSLMMVLGVAAVQPTWAEMKKTQDVDVQFTFNSTISLTVDQQKMTIESMNSGMASDSSEIVLTVDTNNASGYYVSATAGTQETSTDLKSEDEDLSAFKFAILGVNDSKKTAQEMDDNTWGIACAPGAEADLSSQPYFGLPQDGKDNGATGKQILTSQDWKGEKKVKCRFGIKASPTMAAGTYKNVVNFYAVANS